MWPCFDNLPFIDNDNLISCARKGQTMTDNDSHFIARHLAEKVVNFMFYRRVKSSSRFIQN